MLHSPLLLHGLLLLDLLPAVPPLVGLPQGELCSKALLALLTVTKTRDIFSCRRMLLPVTLRLHL